MELNGYLHNWIMESTNKQQRLNAVKVLNKAKQQESNPPEGYRYEWFDGPLRSKVRKLVKIENNKVNK